MSTTKAKAAQLVNVPIKDVILGENARATKPTKEEVGDLARSIALHGILVPLIATAKDGKYHLKGGYTRMAALEMIKADPALNELAKMNEVDISTVPVRVWTGNDQQALLIPILENNLRNNMNDVDLAHHVKKMMDEDFSTDELKKLLGETKFKLLLSILALPNDVQDLIKLGRIKSGTAVAFSKRFKDQDKLAKELVKAAAKVDELQEAGKRKSKKITEQVLNEKKSTPMKVAKDATIKLKSVKVEGSGLLIQFLNGLRQGWDADTIIDKLLGGEKIPEPVEKQRGRKKKEEEAAPNASKDAKGGKSKEKEEEKGGKK